MNLNLLDIIALEDLQELQDTLAKVSHVGAVIVDLNGKHITKPSRFSRFCAMMRANPGTEPTCKAAAMELGAIARQEKRPAQKPCSNLRLSDASAPIILNGEHVASWMIGQCVTHHMPDQEVRAFAKSKGLDEEEVLQAYNEIKVITPEAFNDAIRLLSLFTDNLSQVCYKNYLLQQADVEKARMINVLDAVLSNIEAAIGVSDPQSMEIVFANKAMMSLVHDDNIVGKKCHQAMQGSDIPCSFCKNMYLYDAAGNPLRTPQTWEFHEPHADRDYMVQDILVDWFDGRLLKLTMYINITERRALLAAEAANKAKRDFLAQMSHELRTPMSGVLGMTQLALRADPPPRQRGYLEKIQTSANLLLGVINDVLDFSKIEAGKLELSEHVFNLREMLGTVRDMVMPRVQDKGLKLRINIDQSIPEQLYGDSLRFSQVLMNLVGNSAKFTKEGYIQINMSTEEMPPAKEQKLRLRCSVSDTGIGMTQEQLSRLFNAFTQADGSISHKFGGTGLGLFISKSLVELMGGSIRAESHVGEGSTFSFDLIVSQASVIDAQVLEKKSEDSVNPDSILLAGKRILLAEDNEINQEVAMELLGGFGAWINLVTNGQEAVEAFASQPYDLVLMDVQMPVMDGYEATRQIRAAEKETRTPIIAMTANAMNEDRAKSQEAGMDGHIAKPIDMVELRRVLTLYI